MTDSEFEAWRGPAVDSYAQDFVTSGILTPDEAQSRAEKDFDDLLPEGLATPNHALWTAVDDETAVGILWVMYGGEESNRRAFIYDIEVFEAYRRRGHAKAMIESLSEQAREQGVVSIGLNVFGYNDGAIALYRKLGFEVSSMTMRLRL